MFKAFLALSFVHVNDNLSVLSIGIFNLVPVILC